PTAQECTWSPQTVANNANLKDAGTPPTKDVPTAGTRPMTITTDQGGPITATLDLAKAPCAGASLAHLAGRQFFDNTKCHEITTEGALRCGDPSGTGLGGPTYTFFNDPGAMPAPAPEPSASAAPQPQPPAYRKGSIALIGAPAGSNGSQFLIFVKDFSTADPTYPIVGTVTGGLDVLDKIAKSPTVDNGAGAKVKPAKDILVKTLTVGEPSGGAPATDPSAAPSASEQS
ncbi:MAG TPA: peptidylprolyl isomerase, partial [Catenuloplanes sp.]